MPHIRTLAEGVLGACAIATTILFSPILRPWYRVWGTTTPERRRSFPGDEQVPTPRSTVTCARTVAAPPDLIWPWIVQLGCRRGGWYSYDLLDNGGVPSAEEILPEFQRLAVGDVVPAAPKGEFGFPVASLLPPHALVLAGTIDTSTGRPVKPDAVGGRPFFSGGQAFFVEPVGESSSRLFFRMRIDWNPSLVNTLIYRFLLEPISFVMGRKTVLSIQSRAERLAAKPL